MNKFRIIATTIMLSAVVCLTANAQSATYDKVIKELEADFSLSSVNISGDAVMLLSSFDFEGKEQVKAIADDLESMRLTMCNKGGEGFYQKATEKFAAAGYEDIDVSSQAKNHEVKLFARRVGFNYVEAHVVNAEGQVMIFSVFGKFKLRHIRRLVSINE